MIRNYSSPQRVSGFSLIEMIAAFLIFSIAVGVQLQVLTTSMQTTRSSEAYTMAALWAQSKLDVVGVGERIKPGHSSGEFRAGYTWEMDITQVDPSGIEPPPPIGGAIAGLGPNQQVAAAQQVGLGGGIEVSPIEIYQVDLTMHWGSRGRENTSTFSTLRAVNPDPEALGQGGAALPARQPAREGKR